MKTKKLKKEVKGIFHVAIHENFNIPVDVLKSVTNFDKFKNSKPFKNLIISLFQNFDFEPSKMIYSLSDLYFEFEDFMISKNLKTVVTRSIKHDVSNDDLCETEIVFEDDLICLDAVSGVVRFAEYNLKTGNIGYYRGLNEDQKSLIYSLFINPLQQNKLNLEIDQQVLNSTISDLVNTKVSFNGGQLELIHNGNLQYAAVDFKTRKLYINETLPEDYKELINCLFTATASVFVQYLDHLEKVKAEKRTSLKESRFETVIKGNLISLKTKVNAGTFSEDLARVNLNTQTSFINENLEEQQLIKELFINPML